MQIALGLWSSKSVTSMGINLIACFCVDLWTLKHTTWEAHGRRVELEKELSPTEGFTKSRGPGMSLVNQNNRKLLLINLKINGSEYQSILFEEMSGALSIFLSSRKQREERHWNQPCNFSSVIIPVTTSDRADINSQFSYFFCFPLCFPFSNHRLRWLMLIPEHDTKHSQKACC